MSIGRSPGILSELYVKGFIRSSAGRLIPHRLSLYIEDRDLYIDFIRHVSVRVSEVYICSQKVPEVESKIVG